MKNYKNESWKVKTIVLDITQTVFCNDEVATLYVAKDIFSAEPQFVFSIPENIFSIAITEENYEKNIEEKFKYVNLFQENRREKLKKEMKKIIENWYELEENSIS